MASTRTPGHLMTVRVMLFNLHGDEDKKGANGVDALKVYRQDEDHVIKLRRMNADSYWYVNAFILTVAVEAAQRRLQLRQLG